MTAKPPERFGWDRRALDRLGAARGVWVRTTRADGSLGRGLPVWVVRVGDGLYLRSYKGVDGAWYSSVLARPNGRVELERPAPRDAPDPAPGTTTSAGWDVVFHPETDPELTDLIDAAYAVKYRGSVYLAAMTAPAARATTLSLRPR